MKTMTTAFKNVYEDATRARAYAKLQFANTYYLAFRDLPKIILAHVKGAKALDFGCGTGRSTRFLQKMGFSVVGIDISEDMIERARAIDPSGDYRIVGEGDFTPFEDDAFDLVLSAFTFDNIPTLEKKTEIFTELGRVTKAEGRIINVVSSPRIYQHEWASFTTKDFPENRLAKSGSKVRIVVTDLEDRRPVEDVICSEPDYRKAYRSAGLETVEIAKPLGKADEPYSWVNETEIPPWVIYVLRPMRRRR